MRAGEPSRTAFGAARHRFAEDSLAHAVAAGTTQVVVLGAGFDTFAYRNPFTGTRVFEVDHPATGAWKRERLAEAGIDVPAGTAYVGLGEPLTAGWDPEDLDTLLRRLGFVEIEALGRRDIRSRYLGLPPTGPSTGGRIVRARMPG